MQHRQEKVAERFVLDGIKREVPAVFESASGKENGKVGAVVDIRIAKVASVQHQRVVQ
jgi:hypothetical protein